jgi:hypothetical protein
MKKKTQVRWVVVIGQRWKASMIFNDAIQVQAKEGRKYGNAKGIRTPKTNDYLCAMQMSDDMLNLLLLRINNHNQDKEHTYIVDGIDGPLV